MKRGIPLLLTLLATPAALAAPHHPSRVLVKFKHGARPELLPGSHATHAYRDGLYLVETPAGMPAPQAVQRYRSRPTVAYAELDYLVSVGDTVPSDPSWDGQWDMVKIGAPTAWDTQTDAGDVVVAVIDTGIDYTHPDLQANLWTDPATGAHGFSCIGACAPGGADDYGHGTHVAGTIGAAANNGIGIAGLNWRVQLLSLKFLDASGYGYTSDAILAFDEAVALKERGVNLRLTSNSWGGHGYSQALEDAMARATAEGILHVCAAGNDYQDNDPHIACSGDGSGVCFEMDDAAYPASYDGRGIVSVMATDSADVRASFSNLGLVRVDIAAPGVATLSTVPTGSCPLCDPSGYRLLSGTSMATPHVTGVVAALLHQNPALTPYEARDVLLDAESYDPVSGLAQRSTTAGRLSFPNALANPLLFAPQLNAFPAAAGTPPAATHNPGGAVTLGATLWDPDGDTVVQRPFLRDDSESAPSPRINVATSWLFGLMMRQLFPLQAANPTSFTAPMVSRWASASYLLPIADGRGGSAFGRVSVNVVPSASPGSAPSGSAYVSGCSNGPCSSVDTTLPFIWFSYDDPDPSVRWAVNVPYYPYWSFGNAYVFPGKCCMSPGTPSPPYLNLGRPGNYRVKIQAMNSRLLQTTYEQVVHLGGSSGEPPVARLAVDKASGPLPLTVSYDASASYDPDGTIVDYFVSCDGEPAVANPAPRGTCSFPTSPGPYAIWLRVRDGSGDMDGDFAYVVGLDGRAPSATITSPRNGATVPKNTQTQVTVSASPGVTKVELYVNGALACTRTASPWACTWKVPPQRTVYQLQAKAYDAQSFGWSEVSTVTAR